jgi:diadenosine tetraphosphate (Ap4A) HIT family hydrolase
MPCPFCTITSNIPASADPAILRSPIGSAYPVLSTSLIVAFLDIAPVSRGHILICPRSHATKATDVPIAESLALGFWLPVVARAVMRAVGSSANEGCWNVIQANGKSSHIRKEQPMMF